MSQLRLRHVQVGSAVYLPGDRFGPRTLADYELVLITAGSARYLVNGDEHFAGENGFILARPGFHEQYLWDARQTTRHLFIHFLPERLPDDWPPPGQWPITQAAADHSPMPRLMQHIVRLIEQNPIRATAPGPEVVRQIEALLSLYLHAPGTPPPHHADAGPAVPPPVMRAMDWTRRQLQTDPATPIDLDMLARAAAVNARHLCRLFTEAVDTTPMRWVQHRRLDQARTLLRRSNLSVHQVADRCGFASPFHFSRAYKTRFGKPPSADRIA